MITMDDLEEVPLFTVLRGPTEDHGLEADEWDLFDGPSPAEKAVGESFKRGIETNLLHPEMDDEKAVAKGVPSEDLRAALAYLSEGGTLVKLPDRWPLPEGCTPSDALWRFYAVQRVRGAKAGKALPEKPCVYCGELWEGFYSIHEDDSMEGPEVELCNRCGGSEVPTCREIWDRIASTKPAKEQEEGTKAT